MKTKLGLVMLFACFITSIQAQTNKTTVPYNLSRTFTTNGGAQAGGDLVITTEETPANTSVVCEAENTIIQSIYSGKLLPAVFVNVDNSLGLGCVLIEVKSGGTTIRQTIPAGGVSGVLSFNKVTSVRVLIAQKTSQAIPETVTAKGTVDFWF